MTSGLKSKNNTKTTQKYKNNIKIQKHTFLFYTFIYGQYGCIKLIKCN
jgi:hypothetical protein